MPKSPKSSAEKNQESAPMKRAEVLETSIDKLSNLAKKLAIAKELPERYEIA